MAPMSTARHEASHCAAAILLGRVVDHTWRTSGRSWPGETIGHARIPVAERIEMSQLVIALIGYLSTGAPDWPPSYEDAREEQREALRIVIRRLGVDAETYGEVVEFCRDLLLDPDFIRLRDAIERALNAVPRLEREDIEALCLATHTPIPGEQEAADAA
jgi:hypothetical protein